jgi:hypothetical protein
MLGFSKRPAAKPTRGEAFEKFKTNIREAIGEAREAGIWPGSLRDYLESHALSLNAQEYERAHR